MNARIATRLIALRPLAPRSLRHNPALSRQLIAAPRHASSDSRASKPPSLNAQFYKTFGRPIAKVFLMAIFTYQLVYYFWLRFEQDEIKSEMEATISDLEKRIEELENSAKP